VNREHAQPVVQVFAKRPMRNSLYADTHLTCATVCVDAVHILNV
jgi:hypothetical protein